MKNIQYNKTKKVWAKRKIFNKTRQRKYGLNEKYSITQDKESMG
jgi:hypothetical protein